MFGYRSIKSIVGKKQLLFLWLQKGLAWLTCKNKHIIPETRTLLTITLIGANRLLITWNSHYVVKKQICLSISYHTCHRLIFPSCSTLSCFAANHQWFSLGTLNLRLFGAAGKGSWLSGNWNWETYKENQVYTLQTILS